MEIVRKRFTRDTMKDLLKKLSTGEVRSIEEYSRNTVWVAETIRQHYRRLVKYNNCKTDLQLLYKYGKGKVYWNYE